MIENQAGNGVIIALENDPTITHSNKSIEILMPNIYEDSDGCPNGGFIKVVITCSWKNIGVSSMASSNDPYNKATFVVAKARDNS